MKYRTQLYISLVAIASASIILALVIFSAETEKLVFNLLRSRSTSIAATAAAQLDPALIEKANLAKSFDDPSYQEAIKQLRKVLDANRREDLYVSDFYTVYPSPRDPNQLLFGLETDPNPDEPGTLYRDSDKELILKNRNEPFANSNFITNQFGVWLSGFAPIKDANGKYIATLGLDVSASDIHLNIAALIKYAIWGLISALLLALIIAYFLSKKVTASLDNLCGVVKEIGDGHLEARSDLKTEDEFGQLATQINAMSQGLQERERLKMSFARYVSTHILDRILISESPLNLEGERRKVTLLFSDIRQFTQLAEKLPPEEVVHLLNEYFEQMIEVIFIHSGTLDKFIGDGIMAEFGAPLDDDKQEEHAIEAAIHMQKELDKLCEKWAGEGKPRIQMGIGIHTGEAVVGNIGSERRTEYTAIGDAVNVAARLEQATKVLNTSILLSESTYLGAKNKFPFKDLGSMALPGRKEQIKVYTIEMEKL